MADKFSFVQNKNKNITAVYPFRNDLYVGFEDGRIEEWKDLKKTMTFKGHSTPVLALFLCESPKRSNIDEARMWSSSGHEVRLWNVKRGNCEKEIHLKASETQITCFGLHVDNVVTGPEVKLWETDGQTVPIIGKPFLFNTMGKFHSMFRVLVYAHRTDLVVVQTRDKSRWATTHKTTHQADIIDINFMRGSNAVTVSMDGTICLWSANMKEMTTLVSNMKCPRIHLLNFYGELYCANMERTYLWNNKGYEVEQVIYSGLGDNIISLHVRNSRVETVDANGLVINWIPSKQVWTPQNHKWFPLNIKEKLCSCWQIGTGCFFQQTSVVSVFGFSLKELSWKREPCHQEE